MFGFFDSAGRKMRENATNWLQLADKIFHYRRDQLTEAQRGALVQQSAALRRQLEERADAGKLKLGIESLEGVLRQVGGSFYPKSAVGENVEFFLMAAIIVLGIRTYFLQPFKIPTNSMWPTYHGMKGENFAPGTPAPGPLGQALRFVAFGAMRREATAPADGEISAPFFLNPQLRTAYMAYTVRRAYKWLIIPTLVREYTFYVDGRPATVSVPADFSDIDDLLQATYFPGTDPYRFIEAAARRSQVTRGEIRLRGDAADVAPTYIVDLGRTARAGEPVLRFDLLAGDQLFVDRLSYHFVRPKIGDGFVFRTRNIPEIVRTVGDQYYIKRLVGRPGDTLEIRQPALYRNGQPITGAAAFDKNNHRLAPYPGYRNSRPGDFSQLYLRAPGDTVTVPPHTFFALGDNSANSEDGRYWGFVPEKDVVGRPLFIYFPFTRRWGPAH
ncbi:MAG TPA: signal peptidase I [Opitutaceae bacterium]|nr:signal peptidase I [Opitutaceae bacterium]